MKPSPGSILASLVTKPSSPSAPLPTEAAPLTREELAAQLSPATTPPAPSQPKESSFLQKQFPIFGCAAFTIYLQGIPALPSLEVIRNLALDEACTIPGLLKARALAKSGKHAKDWPQEALDLSFELCAQLSTPEGRLDFTTLLYQQAAKAQHIEVVRTMTEAGIPMQAAKVLSRTNATKELEAWKAGILAHLEAEEITNPAAFLESKKKVPVVTLSAADFEAAFLDL